MHDELLTDRLRLRRITTADLDRLVDLDGDAEVMHYITNGAPTARDEMATSHLPRMVESDPATGYGFWAVLDQTTDDFLGWFHLIPESGGPSDEPELGYRLRRDAWGKGYATEGSRALIELAFEHAQAARVRAFTMAVHAASRRVMEKAGMRHVRTFETQWPVRIPGDELGDVEYAVTRADWEAQKAAEDEGPAVTVA